MSSSVDKMDMSLDQIIKLQRKEAKQNRGGGAETGNRGRGGRIRGRGPGRGRGRGRSVGGSTTSVARASGTAASAGGTKGRKLGVRANLAARRLLNKSRAIGGRGRGRGGAGTTTFQRVARNIVKRAIVQNRRLANQQRQSITTGRRGAAAGSNTQRLAADVRRWRNTARQLQRALQVQQKKQAQSRRRLNTAGIRGQQQITSPTGSNVHQRLGWRGTPRRGGGANRGRGGQRSTVVKGRGTVGQMQSDLIAQSNRQVSIQMQRRQQQQSYGRGQRQQRINRGRNMGGGANTSFNRSPQAGQNRGRRGRGGNRFGARNNNAETSFSQGSGRQSLNERFGGASGGPSVRIGGTKTGYRGRGNRTRQIFF